MFVIKDKMCININNVAMFKYDGNYLKFYYDSDGGCVVELGDNLKARAAYNAILRAIIDKKDTVYI